MHLNVQERLLKLHTAVAAAALFPSQKLAVCCVQYVFCLALLCNSEPCVGVGMSKAVISKQATRILSATLTTNARRSKLPSTVTT